MSEQKIKAGTFCWNELMTRNKDAALKFYQDLLGWEPAESGMPWKDYTILKNGDSRAGGLMTMPDDVPEHIPSHWLSFVAVDNLDELTEKVNDLGGVVCHGPVEVPELGRFIIIQDPSGAVLSLMQFN